MSTAQIPKSNSLLSSLTVSMSNNNTDTCLRKEDTMYRQGSLHIDRFEMTSKSTLPLACKALIGLTSRQGEQLAALIMTKCWRRLKVGNVAAVSLLCWRCPVGLWVCEAGGSFWHGGEERVAVCCIKPQWRCQRHPWRHYGNQIVGSDLRLPWRRHVQRWALLPPGRPQGPSARFLLSLFARSLMCLRVSQARFLILSLWG